MVQTSRNTAAEARREPAAATPDPAAVPPVVGIGASAGGIGAFRSFFEHVPSDAGIAWVVILHMAPDRESSLSEIIGRKTALPVTEVTKVTAIRPDHVYVIAPGRTMTLRDGSLRPVTDNDPLARRSSIDAFFVSLAAHQNERCGCALLSGAGSDGTIGLKAVKEAGGLTVTQTLGDAEYDSMLLSAVRTGLVDLELSLNEMPEAFVDFLVRRHPRVVEEPVGDGDRLQVCQLLRKVTGHDFSGYKTSTIDRRIRRRMQMRAVGGIAQYLQRLTADQEEVSQLYRDLLIGVTQFFRDSDAFVALAERFLPKLLEGMSSDDQLRVWVAGCATGEEAYSLAMLLQEAADRMDGPPALRVFGSDIDENALHVARLGRYPKGIAADVSPQRLGRFFEREDGTYRVRSELREICLFAQHNMLRDPPFSRIDLLTCRNVLIYMNSDLQKRLLPVFHYALRQDGMLLLGPAENAAQRPGLFAESDRAHRIYRRVGEATRLPEFPIAMGGRQRAAPMQGSRPREQPEGLSARAARQVLERTGASYVIIDAEYDIIEASAGTGAYLELPSGRPRANLSAMMRGGLAVDLRAAVGKVMASSKPDTRNAALGLGDKSREISITVEPLRGDAGEGHLYLVTFQELPQRREAGGAQARPGGEDEVTRVLELELQNTKERLQSTLEELETSNEELRVSNEEISSVNEELQSSNEELETSKEELQSINEELRTVNNELNSRVEELSRANNDLKNLLDNTQIAMVFLDRKFRIGNFTPPAKPLFRLRDHDVGRPLDELAGPLDYKELRATVEKVMKSGKSAEREVELNGRERTYIMRMLPYRDEREKVQGSVLAFIDITERKRSERRLATMVSELNHRVKNALAAVQAVVRQTGANASSVEECIDIIDGRLQAMAGAHNLLSARQWEHADLGELVEKTLEPFLVRAQGRLQCDGPALELQSGCAVTMAMVLHELATNAAKYGAWSTPEGRVTVNWELRPGEVEHLVLEWAEHDGPAAPEPDRMGFGLRFITRSVKHELHGKCQPAFGSKGFRCSFTLPASRIRWVPEDPAVAPA